MRNRGNGFVLFACLGLLAACGSDLQKQQGLGPSAFLSVSGGPVYDFGSVTVDTYTDRDITVTNIGSLKATEMSASFYLSVNFLFIGGTYPGTGGSCSNSLPPREFCTVAVRFYPRSAGTLDTFLPISYFDGTVAKTNSDLMLRGKGIGGT